VSATAYPLIVAFHAQTHHAISDRHVSSPRLLTFLLHNLIAYDINLDDCRKHIGVDPWNKTLDEIKSLAGPSVEDAAAYFLAALIARPGDGRRRALEELLDVLRGDERLDSAKRIRATLAIAKTLTALIMPPALWMTREIFAVPVRENVALLASLGAHRVLSDALCRLDVDHPLSKDTAQQISICVEFIIRKGGPSLTPHVVKDLSTALVASQPSVAPETEVESKMELPNTPSAVGIQTPAPMPFMHTTSLDGMMSSGRPIEHFSTEPSDAVTSSLLLHESSEDEHNDMADSEDDSTEDDHDEGEEEESNDEHYDSDSEDEHGDEVHIVELLYYGDLVFLCLMHYCCCCCC
jgi:hypothetical protein